jgi:non-specific serine/threonine protein kinase
VRAKAIATVGQFATFQADYHRALELLEESLALYRTVTDPFGLARLLFFLGDHWQTQGKADASAQVLEEALAGFTALGSMAWMGCTLYYLATTATMKHDFARARALAEEALNICRQAEFGTGMAMSLGHLGTLALMRGDHAEAERHFREALALRLERDDRYGLSVQLTDMVHLAAARGEAERAARLAGAAFALRAGIGAEIDERDRDEYDRLIARLRNTLGDERFEAAWSTGHGHPREQAVAEVSDVAGDALATTATSTRVAPHHPARLTPRELDVLRLLTEGHSDREIAEALFIGPRTVQTHVANLFAKLGVNARAEAAAVAVRRGLV